MALYSWRIGSEIWTEVASRNIFDELFGRVRRISLSFAVRVEMRDEIVRFTAEMKRVAGSGTLAHCTQVRLDEVADAIEGRMFLIAVNL